VLKQDRNPERGRPSGIEGARRLRMDADYVAFSESGGLWSEIHRKQLTGGYGTLASRVGEEEWGIGHGTSLVSGYF